MADFSSIRFLPKRPLMRELSADRLNSILAEIRRNKPKGERGITVRQSGDGTYIGLAASLGSKSSSAARPLPWDLKVSQNEEEGSYTVTVEPGTLNNFLPDNWDDEFSATDAMHYAKAVITTDGRQQTGLSIAIDTTAPQAQAPQEFAVPTTIELLFGIIIEGTAFRTISSSFTASPKLWLTTEKQSPPQPGELPFTQFFFFGT